MKPETTDSDMQSDGYAMVTGIFNKNKHLACKLYICLFSLTQEDYKKMRKICVTRQKVCMRKKCYSIAMLLQLR